MEGIANLARARVFGDFTVSNGLNGRHARGDTTEFGVYRVLVKGRALRTRTHKKLTPIGCVGSRVGHGYNAGLIRETRGLSGPLVAGASGSGVCRVPGLEHERRNYPKNFVAVKEPMPCQKHKVVHGRGIVLGE